MLRRIFLFLIASFPLCMANASPYILKSSHDFREYEYVELENGLQVLLCSDPFAEMASVSLVVAAGSRQEPENAPGLAHLLEHLLSRASTKYPDDYGFFRFINSVGRYRATTRSSFTSYSFSLKSFYLKEGLDRFSQFFIAPLLLGSDIEEEWYAIHAEYNQLFDNESWQYAMLFKMAVNDAHSLKKPGIDNQRHLVDTDLLKGQLDVFFEKYYLANLMTLVVCDKSSISQLKEMVIPPFSKIKSSSLSRTDSSLPLFKADLLPAQLSLDLNNQSPRLNLTFSVPPHHINYKSKPSNYVANLLNEKHPNSPYTILKEKGWINSMLAGAHINDIDAATFDISLELTSSGLEHTDQIITEIFQYLRLIQKNGISFLIFKRLQTQMREEFDFPGGGRPDQYLSEIASNMHRYPIRDIFSGPYLLEQFDPILIEEYLAYLTPSNVLVTVSGHQFESANIEKLSGKSYLLTSIKKERVQQWLKGETNNRFTIPQSSNAFIANIRDFRPFYDEPTKPLLQRKNSRFQFWHQLNNKFKAPKTDLFLSLNSDVVYKTAKNRVLTELFVSAINDELRSIRSELLNTGLDFTVDSGSQGITLHIFGFTDKQPLLFSRVMDVLVAPTIQKKQFEALKERAGKNFRQEAIHDIFEIITRNSNQKLWSQEELNFQRQALTYEDLKQFVPLFLRTINVKGFAYGDLNQHEVNRIINVVESVFPEINRKPLFLERDVSNNLVAAVEGKEQYLNGVVVSLGKKETAVVYAKTGDVGSEYKAKILLLRGIIRLCFLSERPVGKSLAHVTLSKVLSLTADRGLAFIFESDKEELQPVLNDYLIAVDRCLKELDDSEFDQLKKAEILTIREILEGQSPYAYSTWSKISHNHSVFDSELQLLSDIEGVTKESLLEFSQQILGAVDVAL